MVKCREAPKMQHPFVLVAWPFLRDREQASPSTFTRLCAIWSCFGLRRTRCVPFPVSVAVCLHLPALASRGTQAEPWGKPPCALLACCAVRAHFEAKSAGFVLKVVWHFASMYHV